MQMKIRRAQPDDAEVLASVARRSIQISSSPWYSQAHLDQWASAFSGESMLGAINDSVVLVAEDADRVQGFASLVASSAARCELDLLYVDPHFTRRGVARALIGAIEEQARVNDVAELWVDASIPAAVVFERLGYQVQERYSKRLGEFTYENTWLSRRL
jgi:putative acetyltransferase